MNSSQLHEYRFAIDIKSATGLAVNVSQIYCGYVYAPFGSHSPVFTLPPANVDGSVIGGSGSIAFNNSFAAYEFVMDPEHTFEYLRSYPLSIDLWIRDRYKPDFKLGEFVCDCDFTHQEVRDGESLKLSRADGSSLWVLDRWFDLQWTSAAQERFFTESSRSLSPAQVRVVLSLEDFHLIADQTLSATRATQMLGHVAVSLNSNDLAMSSPASHLVSVSEHLEHDLPDDDNTSGGSASGVEHSINGEDSRKDMSDLTDTDTVWIRGEQLAYLKRLDTEKSIFTSAIKEAWLRRAEEMKSDTQQTLSSLGADLMTLLDFEKGIIRRLQRIQLLEDDISERSASLERNHLKRLEEVENISHRYRNELVHQARLVKERSSALDRSVDGIKAQLEILKRNSSAIEKEMIELTDNIASNHQRIGGDEVKPTALDIQCDLLQQEIASLRRTRHSHLVRKQRLKEQWSATLSAINGEQLQFEKHLQLRNEKERDKLEKTRMRQLLYEEKLSLPADRRTLDEIRDRIRQLHIQNKPAFL
jgi:hypothetical protein